MYCVPAGTLMVVHEVGGSGWSLESWPEDVFFEEYRPHMDGKYWLFRHGDYEIFLGPDFIRNMDDGDHGRVGKRPRRSNQCDDGPSQGGRRRR